MRQHKLYSRLNNILMIFLVVQPVLDIYMGIVGERLDVFGISLVTMLRTLFVVSIFIIVIISQIKHKYKLKYTYIILSYVFTVFVYALLHHLNIVSFSGYFITEGIYKPLRELSYVLRLIIPILLIYIVFITKPSKEDILKVVICVAGIISIVIITTNILKVSYSSYTINSDTNEVIEYNFIDWFFMDNLSHRGTLSKGYFVSANQIGALLVFLLPMVIYYTLKEDKWYLYLILLTQIISMVLVGTRVANYGWILVSLAIIIMYTVLHYTKKYKWDLQPLIYFIIILEIGTLIYMHSPSHNRVFASSYVGLYNEDSKEIDETEIISMRDFKEILNNKDAMEAYLGTSSENLLTDVKAKYIYDTYKYHNITNKYILEIYPYEDDLDFWLNIFEKPMAVKGDNRGRQVAIISRIKENNNNYILDTILGMGATPLNSRGYMIENDLISHYYNLGIIGIVLFVAPFLTGVIYALIKNRKQIANILNVEFAVYVLATFMTYFVGYFAGHVIDEYIISIYLGVIAGVITNFYREGENYERT